MTIFLLLNVLSIPLPGQLFSHLTFIISLHFHSCFLLQTHISLYLFSHHLFSCQSSFSSLLLFSDPFIFFVQYLPLLNSILFCASLLFYLHPHFYLLTFTFLYLPHIHIWLIYFSFCICIHVFNLSLTSTHFISSHLSIFLSKHLQYYIFIFLSAHSFCLYFYKTIQFNIAISVDNIFIPLSD